MLPEGFLKWNTVYYYFSIWNKPQDGQQSLLHQCLKKLIGEARIKQARKFCKTSFLIVDAQSVKNTDSTEGKGYDAGKKISGIKRHIAVDTQGLPHALAIAAANVTDRNGALLAFEHNKEELTRVKSILCDGGYSGKPFADGVKAVLGEKVTVQLVKRSELHTFAVIPKRWIVERSFAWFEKQRRLWKNCERKYNTALQFMILTFISLLLRRY